ncbi:MAG TPA: membrane dipeptidase [Acidimicrobiia bacterium]|nr:membrane dipeptidase [Acidimicrobiia bacterium]
MGGAGAAQPGRSGLTGGGPAPAVSPEALALCRSCEVVDLHVETFVWTRILGYDLGRAHGPGPTGARWLGQADLPRLAAGGLSAAVLSIATNPARRPGTRTATLLRNLARLRAAVERDPAAGARRPSAGNDAVPGDGRAGNAAAAVVADLAGYRAARAAGRLAAFLAVQGANAFDSAADVRLVPDGALLRVTLMHLTDSALGATSSPLGRSRGRGGLTPAGRAMVGALNEGRILVDLAHASKATFWPALDAHDRNLPPVVTHTGVAAVHPSWRNLDDDQIRAVADRGGAVGIMYHRGFLGRPARRVGAEAIVRHLEHVIAVGGEEAAALGSDWDGLIVTPRDMPTALDLPVLVDRMLARRWPEPRIRRVLAGNALRLIAAIRP